MRSTRMFQSTKTLKKSAEGGAVPIEKDYVLVVENNPADASLLRHQMEDLGHPVRNITDGYEALRMVKFSRPILIISDITTPGLNGYELCQILKGSPDTSSIPFILYSSAENMPNRRLGYQQGCDDYIIKPFKPLELKVRVDSLLKRAMKTRPRETAEDTSVYPRTVKPSNISPEEIEYGRKITEELSEALKPKRTAREIEPASQETIETETVEAESAVKDAIDEPLTVEEEISEPIEPLEEPQAESVEEPAKPFVTPRAIVHPPQTEEESRKIIAEEREKVSAEPSKIEIPNLIRHDAVKTEKQRYIEPEAIAEIVQPRIDEIEEAVPEEPEIIPEKAESKPAENVTIEPIEPEPPAAKIPVEAMIKAASGGRLKLPSRESIINAAPEELYRFGREIYNSIAANDGVFTADDYTNISGYCEKLTEQSAANNDLLRKALDKNSSPDLATHSVNVAVIAVRIGSNLKLQSGQLSLLCTAALLFDIGMIKVHPGILTKQGQLNRSELAEMHNHVRYGKEMIEEAIAKKYPEDCKYIAAAIYQSHEREEGKGYPEKLNGDQISKPAKIIGVADTYDALCHTRYHRVRQSTYRALQEVVGMKKTFFDPLILRGLVNELTFFPIGCFVRLNTDEIGTVLDTSPVHSMRPKVKVLANSDGSMLEEPRIVDLVQSPFIYVVRALDDDDVPELQNNY